MDASLRLRFAQHDKSESMDASLRSAGQGQSC